MTQAITTTAKQEKEVCFVPFGAADPIKLTIAMVQRFIAVPTKSGKSCSEADALNFLMLCRAQRLDPFAKDAYLIGYDTNSGPKFNLITAHQALLKRAEASPEYQGMESGILLVDEVGTVTERETAFYLPAEKDAVVGGWARVHRKERRPVYKRVRMERFKKNFGVWMEDDAGMIMKCAEAAAMRQTFPSLLGGLYTEGEIIEVPSTVLAGRGAIESPSRLVELKQTEQHAEAPAETAQPPKEEKADTGLVVPGTPQAELARFVIDQGCTFDDFRAWGRETGNLADPDHYPDFDSLPADDCKRWLKARSGLAKGLVQAKGAQ